MKQSLQDHSVSPGLSCAGLCRECFWWREAKEWHMAGPGGRGDRRVRSSVANSPTPVLSVWPSADVGSNHVTSTSIFREVRKRSQVLHFPQTTLDMFSGSARLSADPATSSESSPFSQIPRTAAGWESWRPSHSYPRSSFPGGKMSPELGADTSVLTLLAVFYMSRGTSARGDARLGSCQEVREVGGGNRALTLPLLFV